jgi:hypothetical protein
MSILDGSVVQRLQGFQADGGHLRSAVGTVPSWLAEARADYDAKRPTQPRESRIHKALHAPSDYTLVAAFGADEALVGAMRYRLREDPADLFVTSIGSTGALRGTGVALLAHLAKASLEANLGVRASVDPLAVGFYRSLGWVEIEPGDPGHKWRWPLAARIELAAMDGPAVASPGL